MNKRAISLIVSLAMAMPAYAAWYRDRDNSMVDANDEVGDAMAIVLGPTGTVTQAIQVCPGVYLATAHGALDSPIVARENGRLVIPPGKASMRLIAYPMSRENMTEALDESDYLSPRLRDPSLWENGHWNTDYWNTDYVFITVDEPRRPEAFITPLFLTPNELIANLDRLEVIMYRGKTRYQILPNGDLNFDEEDAIPRSDVRTLMDLYQEPQRVVQSCEISLALPSELSGHVSHDCPTEQGASGAAYITKVDGVNYLTGINIVGIDDNFNTMKRGRTTAGGSDALMSSEFCADYETACGQPCAQLADVLGQE